MDKGHRQQLKISFSAVYVCQHSAVFLSSGPHDPLPCMFSTTPDSNDQLVIRLCSGLTRSHSFESGVVEEGSIENMQGSGS